MAYILSNYKTGSGNPVLLRMNVSIQISVSNKVLIYIAHKKIFPNFPCDQDEQYLSKHSLFA